MLRAARDHGCAQSQARRRLGAPRIVDAPRHFRGVLDFEILDRATLHWIRHQRDLETDPALDVLAEAWVQLRGEGLNERKPRFTAP